jgi:hypothetical protein
MSIQPDDLVTIKKGTVIQTPTHPTQKTKIAKRTYKVRVQYMLPPQAMYVGYRSFFEDGKVAYESVKNHSERDRLNLHEFLGKEVTDEELMAMVVEGPEPRVRMAPPSVICSSPWPPKRSVGLELVAGGAKSPSITSKVSFSTN